MKRKGEKVFAAVINYLILSAFVKTKEDDGIPAWICTAKITSYLVMARGEQQKAPGQLPTSQPDQASVG